MYKHVPNILSTFRMFLVPLFALVYFSDLPNASYLALGIFILAGLTDVLDGYIARKYELITPIGTVLDPLADKLMQLTAISSLALTNVIPLWVMIFLLIKEFGMILSGIIMYFNKIKTVIPANKFGKGATVLLSLGVFLIIIFPESIISLITLFSAIALKIIAFLTYLKHYIKIVRPILKGNH